MNKREFLLTLAFTFFTLYVAVNSAVDPFFPQFHVRPPKNWINDPNGPVRIEKTGIVHLWMQYNPFSAVWGNMSWYHCLSKDYVKWECIGVSLLNDQPYDIGGVFSGSITMVNDVPVIFYTCVDDQKTQLQCLARPADPTDPLLNKWVKDKANPVIASPPSGTNGNTNFRDPSTGWHTSVDPSTWLAVIGLSTNQGPRKKGHAYVAGAGVYQSKDFKTWSFKNYMFYLPEEMSDMFECPDFFPVAGDSGVYTLKYSSQQDFKDYYLLGQYDAKTDTFSSVSNLLFGQPALVDFGAYYASKTFFDPIDKRRILWGWVNEEQTPQQFSPRGWAGIQALPRVVEYDPTFKALKMYPVPELKALRGNTYANVKATALFTGGTMRPLIILNPSGHPPKSKTAQANDTFLPLQYELVAFFSFPFSFVNTTAWSLGLNVRQGSGSVATTVLLSQDPQDKEPIRNAIIPGSLFAQISLKAATKPEQISECRNSCINDWRCTMWRLNTSNGVTCSLYQATSSKHIPQEGCISGRTGQPVLGVVRENSTSQGATTTQEGRAFVRRQKESAIVELRVFVDHSLIEVYKDEGLERIASRLYISVPWIFGVSAFAQAKDTQLSPGSTMQLLNATIWPIYSIWYH